MLKPLFLLSALASAPLKSTWRKVRYEELNKNISKQWCHHDDEGEEWWVYLCVGGGVGVAVEPPPAEPPQVRGGDGGGAGAHPAPVLAGIYNIDILVFIFSSPQVIHDIVWHVSVCLCAWKLIQTNHECRGSWEHETVLCDKIIFMWDCHYHSFYIRAIVHRQLNLLREFSKQDYKKLNWQKLSRDLSYIHISPFTCCCHSEYWGSQLDSPSPLPWTWCYGYYYYT